MSDFGEGKWVIGRKKHRCEYCYGPIPKGESHYVWAGVYEGNWQHWRMHEECAGSYQEGDDTEFMSGEGEMPDRVRAMLQQAAEVVE